MARDLKTLVNQLLPIGTRRRKLVRQILDATRGRSIANPPETYQRWVDNVEPSTVAPVGEYSYRPLISIIVPAYNTPDKYLHPLLDSVIGQTYPNWELVLVEGSPDAERAAAIHTASKRDERIRLIKLGQNHGIAGNTNVGIKEAKGEYIAFLDHDDTLAVSALNEVVRVLQDQPDTDWFYSDEDKLSDNGRERLPFLFKPDWSPELFMAVNYVTHFTVVRAELVRKAGGIRTGFDGVQDFDFALRLLDHKPKIHHIPKVLYHWRYAEGSTAIHPDLKKEVKEAGVRALNEYLQRNRINAKATGMIDAPSNYHVKYATPGNPKASLIIPFKDKVHHTKAMVESIFLRTTYRNYEIILVDNRSQETATKEYLASVKDDSRIKVVSYDEPFNWSGVNNFGRRHASGDILVFLNNDMTVLNAQWLEELVGVALQPEIGAVGAYLQYPNRTIQHAGIVLGYFNVAGHVFRHRRLGDFTYFGLPEWPRNYLAVTGACIAVSARKFDKVGGFDEDFQTAGSDVKFCLDLYADGLRNVYWPFARLTHYENVSVGVYSHRSDSQHDYDQSMKYYRPFIENGDPYYNPNLDLHSPHAERIKMKGL
jgi:O-antigen biosynthesis protein